MFRKIRLTIVVCCVCLTFPAVADDQGQDPVFPVKISKEDLRGAIFQRDEVTSTTHADGHQTKSVTSMSSSDGKFFSGMYRSEKTRIDIDQPYGVNEFMYFLSGGVRLTSSDGTVMTVNAGEAVTMPKEWTGIWETDGYEKIWVIYSSE